MVYSSVSNSNRFDADIDLAILSLRPSVRHAPVLYRNRLLTYHHTFFAI